jgi:DNA (cytosine-5)-methyltransferase 1
VDNTQTITHIGLCAGYGGIELGLKRVLPALRTVALCEIEAFAVANLVAKMEAELMDPAPIWTDLKTFPWEAFRDRVDILTGGYPCQPFSAAGKRFGAEDPRHLWPFIAAGIRLLRPRMCFFENVEGHITLGLSSVISDLEELGYKVSWGLFSASEVGAPHQRKRVFILAELANSRFGSRCAQQWQQQKEHSQKFQGSAELAHSHDAGLEGHWRHVAEHGAQGWQEQAGHAWPSRPGEPQHAWEPPRVVGNAESRAARGQGFKQPEKRQSSRPAREGMGNAESGARLRRASGNDEHTAQPDETNSGGQIESSLGRDADGPASRLDYAELCVSSDNRTDELRLLGNGVVPATAARAFLTLIS